MAFLDNLLSDLIRNSTGFNAKPFVRMVGGKNILLLGGAVVASAIAAEQMKQKPAVPGAPPPPPLPPEAPGAQAGPPPIPEAAPQIPQELLYAVVRTMISGALSDGEMQAEERKLIETRLEDSGLSPDQTKQVRKDLVFAPPPEEAVRGIANAEDRELLYRFGAVVILAEGSASAPEKEWLDKLGAALALAPEKRKALETELFGAT
jgi:uncharacterized membrane protein YebE (DUF533 family)